MTRAWCLPIAAALAAPLVTWLPMLAHKYPHLGLPMYFDGGKGIDLWGTHMLWAGALLTIAALAWSRDKVLALGVAFVTWPILLRAGTMNPTHTINFALGVVMLLAVQMTPARFHTWVRWGLAGSGVAQMGYALAQKWLAFDPLWNPVTWGIAGVRYVVPGQGWYGFGKLSDYPQPLGTLGTVDALGAYAAMAAPLLPVWLLPLAVATVITTKSWGACAALAVGLLVRYRSVIFRRHTEEGWHVVAAGTVAAGVLGTLVVLLKSPESFWARLIMMDFGATIGWLNAPWIGYGLGGWQQIIPFAQRAFNVFPPAREFFAEAHSEPIQWFVETGVLGSLLLVAWLWTHRHVIRHPVWGGTLAALGVSCLGFFTFHVVPTALFAITVLGLATSPLNVLQGDA